MFQTRIHGRGGQGVVTAAELLAVAAFDEGRAAQAFPSFGSERMGAPVVSYCRIAASAIRTREPIEEPDALIIQDATLLKQVDVLSGLGAAGYVLVNSTKDFGELGLTGFAEAHRPDRLLSIPASEIARRHLGRPMPNAVLLGGFAALTGVVGLSAVSDAIRERFPGTVGDRNVDAAAEAYEIIRTRLGHEAAVATGRS